MDELQDQPTFDLLGAEVSLEFAPKVVLEKKGGLSFASELASSIDPDSVEVESDHWIYKNEKTNASVIITDDTASMIFVGTASQVGVGTKLEPIERKTSLCLAAIQSNFKPKIVLKTQVILRYLQELGDIDARVLLAEKLCGFDGAKAKPLGRLIHGFGIRLFCPPFKRKGKDQSGVDWSVNLKLESWLADPTYLFVEADAEWHSPKKWKNSTPDDTMSCIGLVHEFVRTNVSEFLQHGTADDE